MCRGDDRRPQICGNDTHKTTMWHEPIVAGCGGHEYVMQ